jgi:hypothetical protein
VTGRDELLRAHSFAAFDARGTERFDDALRSLYDGWVLWPAIEARLALEQSRREREATQQLIDEALELLRESLHLVTPRRAQLAA